LESETSSLVQKKPFYPPVSPDVIKVLAGFLREETARFGIKKCVIGLSGGIDSTVAAYLAVKALGNQNVLGVLLPYKESSASSISDALTVVKALKIKSKLIDITGSVDAYINSHKRMDKVRKGNIIARMRMIALYDVSNAFGGLVIGTGNKTEILLGYSTIFGDAASAINPIGDLYKTQVWQLAELLKCPKKIVKKKPSADLWIGQSDESELGFTYKEVDELLYYMIDQRVPNKELVSLGFTPSFLKRVQSIITRNQFKRLPPIIAKVSNRTVNVDFRYNRDWNS